MTFLDLINCMHMYMYIAWVSVVIRSGHLSTNMYNACYKPLRKDEIKFYS